METNNLRSPVTVGSAELERKPRSRFLALKTCSLSDTALQKHIDASR